MENSPNLQKISWSIKSISKKLFVLVTRLDNSQAVAPALILAIFVYILIFVNLYGKRDMQFVHDPLYYWQLADSFSVDGNFSFTNYTNDLRGFLFPFCLFIIKTQATIFGFDAKLLFFGYSALLFALLSVYILPRFFHVVFLWRIHLLGRALIALLLFYFWRGHFLYPFSDFPAFTALVTGIILLAYSLKRQKIPIWSIFIGFSFGAAMNIRPVYQVSLLMIILLAVIYLSRSGLVKSMQWLFFVLVGTSLILFPQFKINFMNFQIYSPLVLARYSGEENLFEKHLYWGLKTQKYEIVVDKNYPSIFIDYKDPIALKIQKTNLFREKTYSNYIKIVKRFPLDISVSYFRHLFNGLDIFFSTPLVTNVYANHTLFSIANYLIWFLLIYHLASIDLSSVNYIQAVSIIGVLSPVMLAIPTAVEVRFFLPAYILAYGAIVFGFDYKSLLYSILYKKRDFFRFVILFVLWLAVSFTISFTTITYW